MNLVRRSAVIFFILQAIGVAGWWIALTFNHEARALFAMGPDPTPLLAFRIPDMVLMIGGSVAVATLIAVRHSLVIPAIWFVTGATAFATIYCLSFALITDTGWLGFAIMAGTTILSGNFAIGLSPALSSEMFRTSRPGNTRWIMFKTFAQIVVVWTLILIVIPLVILEIEAKIPISRFEFTLQQWLSAILFLLLSSIGVSAAIEMSRIGRGTPLPVDSASVMVVSKIYGYVRNPMAISGIGQGIAVGLFWGSPSVIVYSLLGAAIWQFIYRRLEEDDLENRFGAAYRDYRENVRCWLPRLRPYKLK